MSSREHPTEAELEMLQHESFSYFLYGADPDNGLVIDKTAADWPASIAATGFALAVYPVAVERGFMPLMGTGDWNDGMNRVGAQGKGESIWLGFFLHAVLMQFANVAQLQGDPAFVELCRKEAAQLRQNIEQHGWDGEWECGSRRTSCVSNLASLHTGRRSRWIIGIGRRPITLRYVKRGQRTV